ncbi:AI-2E family transporter [Agaribacterium haliotis]|uniref:AI-2E family transporter n=1 Tax=Agaribacterium haliotis TaxID=2013869 RepID=UPI000BB57752|nr:AI-2E family transporter [Agaribacterium haliotis]
MLTVFKNWMERYFADEEAVLVAVLLVVGFLVVIQLGGVLAPMITAVIIAFMMQGVVARLTQWGVSHSIAVSLAFVLLAGSMLIGLVYIVPVVWEQANNLVRETPRMLAEGQSLLMLLPERYPALVSETQVNDLISVLHKRMGEAGQVVLSFSLAQIPILISVLIYLVLVPILVFFFLKDADLMLRWLGSMLPRKRPVMTQIWAEMNLQIANYVRGKFIEIVIVAGVSAICFGVLGLKYALLLGVVVGLSVLVPYIGAAVVTVPVAAIGFFQWGWSSDFFYLLLAYAIIQALDGNVLVPLLFSEAVKMHPVAIILAVLVFGGLWGLWGVFFAIPLATLVNAVINAWPTRLPPGEQSAELDADEVDLA